MNTYKLEISLHSYIVSPLIADTIFGHLAWGIARREGSKALEEFLNTYSGDRPAIILSSAFPKTYVPMPELSSLASRQEIKDIKTYSQLKKANKIAYIPVSLFLSGEAISLKKILNSQYLLGSELRLSRLHNTVDRIGGGTLDEIGLFERKELWPLGNKTESVSEKDIYVMSEIEPENLKKLFNWAFESGYGAKASIGAGKIKVKKIEKIELPQNGSRAMALAPFIIKNHAEDLDLRAKLFLRQGKLAYEMAVSMNPFKKPILFYKEGSTLKAKANTDYLGSLLEGVHIDPRIRQYGFAPLLKFEEALE